MTSAKPHSKPHGRTDGLRNGWKKKEVTLELKSGSNGRIIKENDPQQACGRKHEREGVPGFFPILQKTKDGEGRCCQELCLQGDHGKTV